MGRRKKKWRDLKASLGDADTFGTLYVSMCKSKAYQNLSLGAKHLYDMCRVHSTSKECKQCLYKHGEEYGITYSEYDFVFPAAHLAEYGIDRRNAVRYFNELEAAGFIVKKEKNKPMKKVNVYSFSDKWKQN